MWPKPSFPDVCGRGQAPGQQPAAELPDEGVACAAEVQETMELRVAALRAAERSSALSCGAHQLPIVSAWLLQTPSATTRPASERHHPMSKRPALVARRSVRTLHPQHRDSPRAAVPTKCCSGELVCRTFAPHPSQTRSTESRPRLANERLARSFLYKEEEVARQARMRFEILICGARRNANSSHRPKSLVENPSNLRQTWRTRTCADPTEGQCGRGRPHLRKADAR